MFSELCSSKASILFKLGSTKERFILWTRVWFDAEFDVFSLCVIFVLIKKVKWYPVVERPLQQTVKSACNRNRWNTKGLGVFSEWRQIDLEPEFSNSWLLTNSWLLFQYNETIRKVAFLKKRISIIRWQIHYVKLPSYRLIKRTVLSFSSSELFYGSLPLNTLMNTDMCVPFPFPSPFKQTDAHKRYPCLLVVKVGLNSVSPFPALASFSFRV